MTRLEVRPTLNASITVCASAPHLCGNSVALTGLPELWCPVFEVEGFERASIDRFWVGVDAGDPRFDRAAVEGALTELGASRIAWAGARRAP